jgi:hypothetical protein
MEIGPYILEGSIISLKNPLLVTEKCPSTDANLEQHLAMRGLVKKKIVFKTRPKPKAIVPK